MISREWEGYLYDGLMSHNHPAVPDWYVSIDTFTGGLPVVGDPVRIPDMSEDFIVQLIADYVAFVDLRSGDDLFLETLSEWFTTDDILFYQIAYDEDSEWKLSYFNRERKKRIKNKPGKFYAQFQYNRHKVSPELGVDFPNDTRIETLARLFAEDWQKAVSHALDRHREYDVTVFKSPLDIATEYQKFDGTNLQSCMSHPPSDYHTGGVHPCMCYGGDSQVHLAVVFKTDTMERIGRTLIYNGKYVRIYPCNNTDKKHLIENVLRLRGVANQRGSLRGATLQYIPHGDHIHNVIVCPYLDGAYSSVGVYNSTLLVTNEPPDSSDVIDTQDNDLHRIGAIDIGDMSVFESSFDYHCDECGERFNQDENDGDMIETGDYTFCGSECANGYGFELAYVGEGTYQEWTRESSYEWCGDMYTEEALESHDLCLADSGEVYQKTECWDTEKGWYPQEDLIFVKTYEEYKTGRDSPRKLFHVWHDQDTNETLFLFSLNEARNSSRFKLFMEYIEEDTVKFTYPEPHLDP